MNKNQWRKISTIWRDRLPPVGIPTFDWKHSFWYETYEFSKLKQINCSIAAFVFLSVEVSADNASWIARDANSGCILGYSFSTSKVNKWIFSFLRALDSLTLSSLVISPPVSRMNSSLQNSLLILVRYGLHYFSILYSGPNLDACTRRLGGIFLFSISVFDSLCNLKSGYAYGDSG